MKKLILLSTLIALLGSCGQTPSPSKQAAETAVDTNVYASLIEAIETNDLNTFDKEIAQVSSIDSLIRKDDSDNSYTLLGYACLYKRCGLAKKLIDLKANVDIGESDDYLVYDALSVAVRSQDVCLVKLLLSKGSDPNRWNSEDGFTVLSLSCRLNNYEITKLLIEEGAKVDGVGDTGFDYIHFPLLYAVESNNIELVQLLIDHGCKIDIRDKQEQTPFIIAEQKQNQQMLDLLHEALLDQQS